MILPLLAVSTVLSVLRAGAVVGTAAMIVTAPVRALMGAPPYYHAPDAVLLWATPSPPAPRRCHSGRRGAGGNRHRKDEFSR